jgi:fumarate reductase subunit C
VRASAAQRYETVLWIAQRLSAAVLALCVAVHLVTVVLAVRGGLSAAEILGRTKGSLPWLLFYGTFVVAVAIHAPVGMRSILREHTGWRGSSLEMAMVGIGLMLLILGWRSLRGLFA